MLSLTGSEGCSWTVTEVPASSTSEVGFSTFAQAAVVGCAVVTGWAAVGAGAASRRA
nr:hypothetical protein GCM10020093_103150 [Planobispora longispora]